MKLSKNVKEFVYLGIEKLMMIVLNVKETVLLVMIKMNVKIVMKDIILNKLTAEIVQVGVEHV